MDWVATLQVNDRGRPLPYVHNAIVIFENWDETKKSLRFNAFKNQLEWKNGSLTEVDVTKLRAKVTSLFFCEFTKEAAYQALEAVAHANSYHPIRDYLDSLTWDFTPRLRGLFGDYFVTQNQTPLYAEASRRFAVGAVARIYRPGAKVDTYPVLEGKQGIYKSSGVAALVGNPDWFSDTRIDLGSKDAYISLNGKWIYEVAELDSFKGWGSTRLKSFVTSAYDSYRPPYGRMLQSFPRQTVFVATTNESDYVSDWTGERRKWPIPVTTVDLAAIERDRDQLWAEARVAYEAGERWHLEGEAAEEMAEAAMERSDSDPLDEELYDAIRHKLLALAESPMPMFSDLTYLSVGQIYAAMGADSTRSSPQYRGRVTTSLRRLGFIKGPKRRVGTQTVNTWRVPDALRAEAEAKRLAKTRGTPGQA